MDESDIYKSRADSLVRMFALDESTEEWSAEEMTQMLADQLATPVTVGAESATLAALLESAKPSEALLNEAKRVNKPRPGAAADAVRDIQTVIYYAVIVAGRVKLGVRLTELPDAALLKGVRWALEQAWVKGAAREVLSAGENLLAATVS